MWPAWVKRIHHTLLPVGQFLGQVHIRAFTKAFVFGILLLNVQASEYSLFSLILIVLWALYVFFTPVQRTFAAPVAWLTLVALALLMPSRFTLITPQWAPHHVLPEHVFAIIFAFFCYVFVCIALRIIKNAERWYQALHAGLVWGISLLFVAGQSGAHPIRATIIGAVLLYFLSTEYFKIHGQQAQSLIRFASALIATQFVEVAWALRLLPISVGYVAAVLAVIAVIATSASEQYMHGTLRAPFLRYSAIVLLVMVCIVGFFSRWII